MSDDVVSSGAVDAPMESQGQAEQAVESWKPKVLKVNGKEISFNSKAEYENALDKYLPIGMAANEKFNAAKQLHEEAQSILDVAKNEKSAKKMLEKAGYSSTEVKQILEEELRKMYEYEDLSPEERARLEEQKELERYRQAEAERKKQDEFDSLARDEQNFYTQIEEQLVDALMSSSLPKDPLLGKFALQYMAADEAKGLEPDAKRAVKMVERELPMIFQGLLSKMDVNGLKGFLGDNLLKQLREDAVQQVKKAESPFSKPPADKQNVAEKQASKPSSESVDDSTKYMSPKEFRQKIRGF